MECVWIYEILYTNMHTCAGNIHIRMYICSDLIPELIYTFPKFNIECLQVGGSFGLGEIYLPMRKFIQTEIIDRLEKHTFTLVIYRSAKVLMFL